MSDDRMQREIAALCRYIEQHADARLTLADLGRRFGLGPHHLQRSFKAATGLSPLQYQTACRLHRLKSGLRAAGNATDAIYEAGFGSISRVYEKSDARLGMTPRQYRRGGAGTDIAYALAETPLGPLLIGATVKGVCFAQFGDNAPALLQALQREFPHATRNPAMPDAPQLSAWLDVLVDSLRGTATGLDIPLDLRGTPFQLMVWHHLQTTPRGSVNSYAEVARALGRPAAARAVAGACAANRIALLLPCHRVIRGDGGLGGYRWGLERKEWLIAMERAGAE